MILIGFSNTRIWDVRDSKGNSAQNNTPRRPKLRLKVTVYPGQVN